MLSSATSSSSHSPTTRPCRRPKCAHLQQDLVAAAALPLHSAHFTLQLLDLAHRWSEKQDNSIHIFDVLSLATTVYIFIKMNPAPAQGPQHARPLADLLAAIARLLSKRQPDCEPSLHTRWTIQNIVTEEYRILEVLNYELVTQLQQLGSRSNSRDACSFRWYLPACSLTVRILLQKRTFGTILLP